MAWVVARRWKRYNSLANGRALSAACWALRIFDAATICIALVIWAVLRIDLIRRRMSRVLAIVRNAKTEFRKQNKILAPQLWANRACPKLDEIDAAGSFCGWL